jgi:diguanylate cyclase (GGDEF)-like protein
MWRRRSAASVEEREYAESFDIALAPTAAAVPKPHDDRRKPRPATSDDRTHDTADGTADAGKVEGGSPPGPAEVEVEGDPAEAEVAEAEVAEAEVAEVEVAEVEVAEVEVVRPAAVDIAPPPATADHEVAGDVPSLAPSAAAEEDQAIGVNEEPPVEAARPSRWRRRRQGPSQSSAPQAEETPEETREETPEAPAPGAALIVDPEPDRSTVADTDPQPESFARRPYRGVAWTLVALFAAGGLAAAAVAGWQWGNAVDGQARQSFDRQASAVATSVTTALQRDTDVAASAAAVVAQDPHMTNAGMAQWLAALTAGRVPNALGLSFIAPVSASDLFFFRVGLAADPTSALLAGGPFTIVPPGAGAPYCFTRTMALDAAVKSAADAAMPAGLDWCATAAASALATARDTGQLTVARALVPDEARVLGLSPSASTPGGPQVQSLKSIDAALGQAVVIYAPVYDGTAPATAAGRRAAFEGWVGALFDTGRILAGAVGNQSALQVTLARQNAGAAPVTIASHDTTGAVAGMVDTVGTRADGRWTVTVSRPAPSGWATGRVQGLAVGGGVALVVLLLALVLGALVVSRRRALELASTQSGELHHMELHDDLTGLPNRSLLVDRAEQMLSRSRRSQLPTAALAVGIDDFKAFNAAHGRGTGDELLRSVADRLAAVLREADTVGRLGGDEFVVLTDGASLAAGPELVAERILSVLGEPFYLGEGHQIEHHITASVGIALGPRIEAEDLLRDASVAMSEAKTAGKGRYSVFGQDMPQAVEGRKQFENELRTAVATNQFFLRYQPIFDIDSRMTTGVEALLRWQHPTRRVIPPDHFLPLLEETGLIVPLGRWVLQEACRRGAALHASGYRIAMSVNASARQIESDTFVGDVGDALAASDFDPHALVIEITETTLMRDTTLMVDRLIALKALGVRIAIDDFGTGYSSLAYLRQFPVDILKIDRSFISSVSPTQDSSMIIHTLVQFGKTLGLETIAEGIEEEGQLDPLLAEQCEAGQGFLYGRPLSPTQLDIFLRTHLTRESPLWVVPPVRGAR